jgi:hypothetical protein
MSIPKTAKASDSGIPRKRRQNKVVCAEDGKSGRTENREYNAKANRAEPQSTTERRK